MRRPLVALFAVIVPLWLAGAGLAEESKAAQATRKNLQQKLSIEAKEIGTKAFLEDVNRELDKEIKFIIDNASGVSNNTKITYKGKNVTVEQVLNEVSDKLDCGWYVVSNAANNKIDGKVMIRKSSKGKERGYEAGKDPKKADAGSSPLREPDSRPVVTASSVSRPAEALSARE